MELTGGQDMKFDMYFSAISLIVVNMGLFVMLILGNYLAAQTPEYYIVCMDPKSCEIYHMCSNCNCRADIAIY